MSDKPIQHYNIFLVSKALEGISNEPTEKITFTKNEAQANRFLKTTTQPGVCSIECYLHPTLNTIKGVIFAPVLKDLKEEDIINGLKDQGVVKK